MSNLELKPDTEENRATIRMWFAFRLEVENRHSGHDHWWTAYAGELNDATFQDWVFRIKANA